MDLSLILTTLLQVFAISPDLCAEVYRDPAGEPYTDLVGQTLSRYCQWTTPDAPVLDAEVCCIIDEHGAGCWLPEDDGGCSAGSRMYCEYGETSSAGVVCYQPLPSMCDAGLCVEAPDLPPPGLPVYGACCSEGGVCQLVTIDDDLDDCQGYFLACDFGVLNEDGTVECFD